MTGPSAAFRVYAPEYGTVSAVVVYGLVVLVVASATDALTETLRAVAPEADPGLLELSMAATLWIVLALVVVGEARRQTADNPHEFLAREVVVSFLDGRRPSPARHLLAVATSAVGGAVTWLARERFLATLDGAFHVLTVLAETGSPGAFEPVNLAWGAGFVLGVAALGWGADRLLIGLLRELQYRRYRRLAG